jgi:hypothetical protein
MKTKSKPHASSQGLNINCYKNSHILYFYISVHIICINNLVNSFIYLLFCIDANFWQLPLRKKKTLAVAMRIPRSLLSA